MKRIHGRVVSLALQVSSAVSEVREATQNHTQKPVFR